MANYEHAQLKATKPHKITVYHRILGFVIIARGVIIIAAIFIADQYSSC